MKRQRTKRFLAFTICAVMLVTGLPFNLLPLPEKVKESIDYINPFITFANAANVGGVGGGSTIPGGTGAGGTDTSNEAIPPTAPQVGWDDGDAWEFSVWVNGTYIGSALLYGDYMVETMGVSWVTVTKVWGPSLGIKNSTTYEGGNAALVGHVTGMWRWSQASDMVSAGKANNTAVFDKVMTPLRIAGVITPELLTKLQAQAGMTAEQAAADPDWKNIAISAEPYGLVRMGSGGPVKWWKREALWATQHTFANNYWWNICLRLSQAWVTEDVVDQTALATGGNPTWLKDPKWHAISTAIRDNYVVWWNYPGTLPPPPPDDDPDDPDIDHQEGWEEIRIFEHEILAGIPNVWEPGGTDPSEQLNPGEPNGYIKVMENYDCLPQQKVHRTASSGEECGNLICGESEGCDCSLEEGESCTTEHHTHEDACYCHAIMIDYWTCWREYKWTWTVSPKAKFDEDKLTSVKNITADGIDVSYPTSMSSIPHPNKYQMTRKGDRMDLEFYVKGQVFQEWTWNNSYGGATTTVGSNTSGNICTDSNWESYSGTAPEPFKLGFTVVFNSHRFAKFGTEDLFPLEKRLLPLAGYMMETAGNQEYWTFMLDRELYLRVNWKMNEDNAAIREGLYKGHTGRNIKWGHGGDWGVDSASSDVIWNNEWKWVRTDHAEDYGGRVCPDCGSEPVVNHPSGCAGGASGSATTSAGVPSQGEGSGSTSDVGIHTSRACFGRTLIVEPTKEGERKVDWRGDGKTVDFYIRKNSDNNDRITFTIPSTVFDFSPTYKMYADYVLDTVRDLNVSTDTWILATDVDSVQFYDILDWNLIGGDTVVRAPWSRDLDDLKATDPNSREKINVVKAGNEYHVNTTKSSFEVTMVVHHWDTAFWQDGISASRSDPYVLPDAPNALEQEMFNTWANKDNEIVGLYRSQLTALLEEIKATQPFGFYTNLVGGTSYDSLFRYWANSNPTGIVHSANAAIFAGGAYTSSRYGTTMAVTDPTTQYPKLELTLSDRGQIGSQSVVHAATDQGIWRLNASWDIWDCPKSTGSIQWSDGIFHTFVPDMQLGDNNKLRSVMTEDSWYVEDYEGIMVTVFKGSIDIPAIASNPATIYEKLSDFQSHMNQWAPEMKHTAMTSGSGMNGHGNATVIPEGTVAAGTYLRVPDFILYPGGVYPHVDEPPAGDPAVCDFSARVAESELLSDWQLNYEPYRFGVRGSSFDN